MVLKGSLTIGGAGVISGGLSSETISWIGYYEFDIVFEANKNIEITTSGSGSRALTFSIYITTNCNAPQNTSGYNGANNYMLTT